MWNSETTNTIAPVRIQKLAKIHLKVLEDLISYRGMYHSYCRFGTTDLVLRLLHGSCKQS